MTVRPDEMPVGSALPPCSFIVTRADLVRYAGTSGDFNPIHWSRRAASAAGLPDVIAHGMLTMAVAGRAVTAWTGDPGAVTDYQVRFTKAVVVPDDDTGIRLTVTGTVTEILTDGRLRLDLCAAVADHEVLSRSSVVVRRPR